MLPGATETTMRTWRTNVSTLALLAMASLVGCGNQDNGFCFPNGDCNGVGGQGGSGINVAGGSGGNAGTAIIPTGGTAGSAGSIGVAGTGGSSGNAGSGGACDTTAVTSCGSCDNNCNEVVLNVPIDAITCTNGTCGFKTGTPCAANYYDADNDPSNGCEVGPCKKTANKDESCDGIDNDCDGKIDEDVDLCSAASCGSCKQNCNTVFPNATGLCVKNSGAEACSEVSVSCQLDPKGCAPGFYDANGIAADGCEYSCTPRDSKGDPLPAGQTPIEICGDNIDNDCDGKIDADDPDTQAPGPNLDPQLCSDASCTAFKECFGGDKGVCATTKGTTQCAATGVVCQGAIKPGQQPEQCNNVDDDCNGIIDDGLSDTGLCGMFSLGKCRQGQNSCTDGASKCLGSVEPDIEVCNNVDDDCDDIIDGSRPDGDLVPCTSDSGCAAGLVCRPLNSDNTKSVCAKPSSSEGGACDEPDPKYPSPCKAGSFSCVNAALICKGSVTSTVPDACGVDTNCNGVLENQPDLQNDPTHCGSCTNDCTAQSSDHVNWLCVQGMCQKATDPATKCQPGFIDCDGNADTCERACTFLSSQEVCNGIDDNCDCNIDEPKSGTKPDGVVVPSVDQTCGVSASAGNADPACGAKTAQNPNGIDVQCQGGKFVCTFPANHCTGSSCAATPDICDGLDNDCNGTVDDSFRAPIKSSDALGAPCASDDGLGKSDGECRATGTYVCSSDKQATVCSVKGKALLCGVVPGNPAYNQKACDEVCDGKDNDCDGKIDEPRLAAKSNPFDATARTVNDSTSYMKPAVVKIGPSLWMHQYEVSRPLATSTTSGNGNGYWGGPDTPAGTVSDRTPACNDTPSGTGRIPWFNVSPIEVEDTCNNMGGRICKLSEWKAACAVNGVGVTPPTSNCSWGYDNDKDCKKSQPTTCNLQAYNGSNDALLPVGSLAGQGCFADWGGFLTSGTGANNAQSRLFDITGNLREITIVDSTIGQPAAQRQYALMGGAFNTSAEDGAKCDFSFYTVASSFTLYTTGFRCCFDEYPD